jgi:methionine-rich copper-binding protein CopC
MRNRFALSLVLLLGSEAQADAHAFLLKANPAVGSTVAGSVTELRLEFTEAIELALSGVELTSASGTPVPLGSMSFADSGHRLLIGKTRMLMSGSYRVKWHVVSADTHRTEGSFTFTVKP